MTETELHTLQDRHAIAERVCLRIPIPMNGSLPPSYAIPR
jgi:hypothetical protein